MTIHGYNITLKITLGITCLINRSSCARRSSAHIFVKSPEIRLIDSIVTDKDSTNESSGIYWRIDQHCVYYFNDHRCRDNDKARPALDAEKELMETTIAAKIMTPTFI